MIDDGSITFLEDMRNYPCGLVKEMISSFGRDFQDLHDIEGVHSVKYLVSKRKLEIESTELGYQEVRVSIDWIKTRHNKNVCISPSFVSPGSSLGIKCLSQLIYNQPMT